MTNKQYDKMKILIKEAVGALAGANGTGSQATRIMDSYINQAKNKIQEMVDYSNECWRIKNNLPEDFNKETLDKHKPIKVNKKILKEKYNDSLWEASLKTLEYDRKEDDEVQVRPLLYTDSKGQQLEIDIFKLGSGEENAYGPNGGYYTLNEKDEFVKIGIAFSE